MVLFDGKDLSQWRDKKPAARRRGQIEDGVMVSAKATSRPRINSATSSCIWNSASRRRRRASGQGRGNSGVFSWALRDSGAGLLQQQNLRRRRDRRLYGQHPPLANACRPPGEWQTYDIIFTVPHFGANGEVLSPGYVTVILNGVVVQNHQAVSRRDQLEKPRQIHAARPDRPAGLQYHNNSVSFRNIWVRPVPWSTNREAPMK
jgi:hypothetical protein